MDFHVAHVCWLIKANRELPDRAAAVVTVQLQRSLPVAITDVATCLHGLVQHNCIYGLLMYDVCHGMCGCGAVTMMVMPPMMAG